MKHLTTMKHLPTIINFTAGLLLLMLGLAGYASPDWFFTHKYDVLMPSPQSRTILRVMMGFMAVMGALWLAACILFFNQRRLLFLTGIMTAGFVASRIGGLLIDGLEQHFTYFELGFETIALIVIIVVYRLTRPSQ
ncbi:MAG: DUF4345 family protein [Candidatus Arcticimaribacter sp.]